MNYNQIEDRNKNLLFKANLDNINAILNQYESNIESIYKFGLKAIDETINSLKTIRLEICVICDHLFNRYSDYKHYNFLCTHLVGFIAKCQYLIGYYADLGLILSL